MFFEAGVMIHSGFCASNEPKFELARYLGECRDNEENLRSMFSEILAGTAVKASGTGARRPVDVCFARTGVERRCVARCRRQRFMGIGGARGSVNLGFARTGTEWRLSQQAENRFRVTKALLAQDLQLMRSRHFLFTLKACCAIMSIEFFDGLETT